MRRPADHAFKTLLVEDDEISRMLLLRVLQSRGHQVHACGDAESAIELWNSNAFECILLDWVLPKMSGVEFCRSIRRHASGEFPVILVITARDTPKDLLEALDAGADDYLVKPTERDLLNVRLTIAERKALERMESRQMEEAKARLEDQVRYAQKLESMGILAGGIAHDFNNLLMTILGNANLAQLDLEGNDTIRRYLETIEETALRASTLTNQLLAYSGRGKFTVVPINLSDSIRDMQQVLSTVVNKKAVVHYELHGNLPPISADLSQIRQVLVNLAVNASEAIGDRSGYIRIETGVMEADREYLTEPYMLDTAHEGMYVFLEVTDTGIGMDEDTMDRIFDPFFTTKFVGRGLGLAAVLGIVRGHKGAIKVSSDAGVGSTFRVLFPVMPDTEAQRLKSRATPKPSNWSDKTVLVADDEESVRSITKLMLQKMGFTVLTAKDGMEALDIFKRESQNLDLVVLDVTMPQLDGGEVLAEIRRANADLKVILTSGYSESEAKDRYAHLRFSGFLHKPYGNKDLETMLITVLGARYT
ncbi:MAG: hypothetical protein AMXMBFR84_15830 [Candidatus Hydrogenedentota bacterium]